MYLTQVHKVCGTLTSTSISPTPFLLLMFSLIAAVLPGSHKYSQSKSGKGALKCSPSPVPASSQSSPARECLAVHCKKSKHSGRSKQQLAEDGSVLVGHDLWQLIQLWRCLLTTNRPCLCTVWKFRRRIRFRIRHCAGRRFSLTASLAPSMKVMSASRQNN